jgi:hypothetical protein
VNHGRRAAAWSVAALVAFNLFLHLPISDVFDGLARRYGFTEYDTVTRAAFLLGGNVSAVRLWWPYGAGVRKALVALAGLIAIAQALIVVNGIEAIHYPQYALMAGLLVRAGLGLERSWIAATALGAVDEIWQWQTLPRAVPGYLDWNDILLNAVGGALGLLVVIRLRRAPALEALLPMVGVAGAVAIAGLIASVSGPLVELPFYRQTPGGRWFHLMSPFEAVVCLSVVWWVARDLASARIAQPSP